jgi:ABC-type transport system involved in Fe-S cluster assembly fused permease/ATPase subunit
MAAAAVGWEEGPLPLPLSPLTLRGEILFRNVSFAYPLRDHTPVLRRIDLHIPPGRKVAIVGGAHPPRNCCLLFVSEEAMGVFVQERAAERLHSTTVLGQSCHPFRLTGLGRHVCAVVVCVYGHAASGGGKSTILRLLCRQYDADNGSIYLDGKEVRS